MASKTPTDRIDIAASVDPGDYTSTQTGSSVDLQNADGAMITVVTGTISGTTSVKVEHSDDDSSWSDVPASDLNGSLSDLSANEQQTIDYQGTKRYVRVSSTAAGTSVSTWGAYVVRTNKRKKP